MANIKPNAKKKIITFRPSTATQEILDSYCAEYNTTVSSALEELVGLGIILKLSNEYNGEGKNE